MVQGKKCLAVHSALPPIVFVFLPERIGGEQEHAAEENVRQDKRDVHGNETVNHADNKNANPFFAWPTDTGSIRSAGSANKASRS